MTKLVVKRELGRTDREGQKTDQGASQNTPRVRGIGEEALTLGRQGEKRKPQFPLAPVMELQDSWKAACLDREASILSDVLI